MRVIRLPGMQSTRARQASRCASPLSTAVAGPGAQAPGAAGGHARAPAARRAPAASRCSSGGVRQGVKLRCSASYSPAAASATMRSTASSPPRTK